MVEDGVLIDEAEPFDALIERIQGLEERTNATTKADTVYKGFPAAGFVGDAPLVSDFRWQGGETALSCRGSSTWRRTNLISNPILDANDPRAASTAENILLWSWSPRGGRGAGSASATGDSTGAGSGGAPA